MLQVLELIAASYLLILSLAAAWGRAREILVLPILLVSTTVRIPLWLFSRGQVDPLPAKRWRRGVRRGIRRALQDIRQEQLEEMDISWQSSHDRKENSL